MHVLNYVLLLLVTEVYHICEVYTIEKLLKGGVNLYEKYQALLEKSNETTYQVAKKTGISQTAFSNWKAGRSEPSVDSLKKLADHFGVPMEYFLE